MPERLDTPEVARVQLDASQIEYPYEEDKERYGEANTLFCETFNSGEKFAIVFTSPLYEDTIGNIETGSPASPSNGELYYAVAVLADGQRMPYPLLEDAGGRVFKTNEVKTYWEAFDKGEETPRVAASKDEFANWMEQTYGEQFTGVVEAHSGDQEDRTAALETGAQKAKEG